jgi:adenylate cyclase
VSPDELAALERGGLYDPATPWAADRLKALELLLEHGATVDDLVAAGSDDLGRVAAGLMLRPGGSRWTRAELAEHAGMPVELVERIWRAAALPDPGPDARITGPDDVAVFRAFADATTVFDEDVVMQTTRVLGASAARLADTMVSAFMVNVRPNAMNDPSCLSMVRANFSATALVPPLMQAFDQLLRQHMLLANRLRNSFVSEDAGGPLDGFPGQEVRQMAVGFLDLVDSTGLAQELPFSQLGAVMSAFERETGDTVVRHGGRVIKLIGDEIMFTAADPSTACAAAFEVCTAMADHPVLRGVHGGIAAGEVLVREGDCFGPVVNLAARLTKRADVNEVVVDQAVASDLAGRRGPLFAEPLGEVTVAGVARPVAVSRLVRADLASEGAANTL